MIMASQNEINVEQQHLFALRRQFEDFTRFERLAATLGFQDDALTQVRMATAGLATLHQYRRDPEAPDRLAIPQSGPIGDAFQALEDIEHTYRDTTVAFMQTLRGTAFAF